MAGHEFVDNVKWRSKTRSVVYFNMFMSFITLIFGIVIVCWISDRNFEGTNKVRVWFAFIASCLAIITTLIEMGFSIMLVRATQLGADSELALRRSIQYRIINFILLLLVVTASALVSRWEFLLVQFLWRGMLLFVVSMFIEELK